MLMLNDEVVPLLAANEISPDSFVFASTITVFRLYSWVSTVPFVSLFTPQFVLTAVVSLPFGSPQL